ncbi:complement component receptor 1-like protein [Clavelina lepadiformis]|uniref:complement component receptor 1-like protein n=1 Tax=Clavelina lepadiformis TaxID=159417 RepID=UPI0040435990
MNSFKILAFLAVCFSHQAFGFDDYFHGDCFKPTPPANGKITPKDRSVFFKYEKIWISCGTKYDLVGAKHLTCLRDDTWSPALPKCVPKGVRCEKPKEPRDGFIIPNDQSFFDIGKKIWFKCNREFELDGVKDLECLDNGKWSDDFPTCKLKSGKCRLPDAPQNGYITPNGQTYFDVNDRISFHCRSRYFLVGKRSRTCLPNGKWSHRNPLGCFFGHYVDLL